MNEPIQFHEDIVIRRMKQVFVVFVIIGGFFIVAEHRAHVIPYSRFPGVDWTSHDAGHLLEMMFRWRANPHFGPFHVLSFVLIGGGFWLLSASWRVLYRAQRRHDLAKTGPYARLRHPQYVGFVLIMFGFLVQWPTIVTLVMFPVLVTMYVLLALREEREAGQASGLLWREYAAKTPRFIPHLREEPGAHVRGRA